MTRLVLIRHGETDWNVEGRYQGQADPPLNARGLAQARRTAESLRGVGLAALYSSPLRRAAQTAAVIAETLGLAVHFEPRLMEIHLGVWQSRLTEAIQREYPALFRQWERAPWETRIPEGETLRQVRARVYAAADEIISRHAGETVGLVSHRIPIALLKIRYQHLPPEQVRAIEIPNASWEVIPLD